MSAFAAFASGLVFGIGLLVAGMADPAKILGFLDIAGPWDPSLAVVMAGALPVSAVAYAISRRRATSYYGAPFNVPTSRELDSKLIAGAAVFGIGWGLAGVCPGPGFVMLGAGRVEGVLFVAAMMAGMLSFEGIERHRTSHLSPVATDA
jgi:uncharacterized membrane protein YedE/YeeE